MARALKTRAVKCGSKEKTKKFSKKPIAKKLSVALAKPKMPAKKLAATEVAKVAVPEKKNVSQKLIETIERRKQERAEKQGAFLAKKPGRRGRRPKNVEYTPNNNEEDQYVFEPGYERLEYDTGIRLKDHSEDSTGGLERVEDFDEELNFDW